MQLTTFVRSRIVELYDSGFTQLEISKKVGVSQSTVSDTLKKNNERESLDHATGNGRPNSLDEKDIGILNKIYHKNPKTSLRKMAEELVNRGGNAVSHSTIRRWHNKNSRFAFSPIKKPLLSKKNFLLRRQKAEEYLLLSDEEIQNIIFSDECKFNLVCSDGKVSVWRRNGTGLKMKNLTPTVKHGGGSIMVWGCFSYYGTGKLVFIDGTMDSIKYVDILSNNLPSSAALMGLSDYTFQQDNDPKHTSKLAKRFFETKEISVLPWAPQSPDLNPIETLWAIIKQKLVNFRPKNKEELKQRIIYEWNNISLETCQGLAMGFKKRANAVFEAKGGHTKY